MSPETWHAPDGLRFIRLTNHPEAKTAEEITEGFTNHDNSNHQTIKVGERE
jgi:hypothetical protein